MMLKRKVKNYIDQKIGKTTPSLPNNIGSVKYISFDIFDTLVVRDVNKPTDVFAIMEEQLGINGFYEKRIKAERDSRLKVDNGEVSIEDIYSCIEGVSREDIERYIQLELSLELKICHSNPDIIDFYNECRGKYRIVLISDMYLCKEQIKLLLDSCGIEGYENLYVSCDVGKSKWTGELYDYVLSDLGINRNEIIHIGNDSFSDAFCAFKRGIRSIKVKPHAIHMINKNMHKRHNQFFNSIQFDQIYNFICNTTKSKGDSDDFYYRFGYENLGVLLLGFCKWLNKSLKEEGIEQVLFVARDGYIIKKAYDALDLNQSIPSYYFEMSRRSIRVPSSYSSDLSYEEMIDLLPLPSRANIEQLFDAWGIDSDLYQSSLSELGITKDDEFWTKKLKSNEKINKLYCELKPFIIQNALDEQNTLLDYIDQFNLWKKTAIVDIGWGGTIQKELLKTLKKHNRDSQIYGYYIALDKRTRINKNNISLNAKGYIWDNYNNDCCNPYEEKPFAGLFETFFLEHSGSVKRYIKTPDGVIADRYPYEYLLSGSILDEPAFVYQIQKGAIDFILASKNSSISLMDTIEPEYAFFFINNCMVRPTNEIVHRFGDARFFNSGGYSYLAHPKMSLLRYCFHPNKCVQDFYESQWKIGFLKALIKADLNYVNLWKLMGKTVTNKVK